jgi:RNA polymerase sigma-70 factor (ECF subfamily)
VSTTSLTAPISDDLQAVRRLKRGDIGGLEILIARYQVKAIRAAFLIVHDEALAEDVVQDTFIRFFQRARYFDETRPFEPYFMRGVVNAALNAVDKESKTMVLDPGEEAPILEALLDHAASIETQVELSQLKRQIASCLSNLPPRQRAVIVQRYYLEMSEREMAEALDTAPGTIKWLLHTARTRLKSLLASEGGAE